MRKTVLLSFVIAGAMSCSTSKVKMRHQNALADSLDYELGQIQKQGFFNGLASR